MLSAVHAQTVERFNLGPCDITEGPWPYDCDAKRKHPDHHVFICHAHLSWWHVAPEELASA